MILKKLAPAKAGVADFSDRIMRKIKGNRVRAGSTLSKNALRTRHCWPCHADCIGAYPLAAATHQPSRHDVVPMKSLFLHGRLQQSPPIGIICEQSERSAARLAHQSGGLGVPSSNLGAPTNKIKDLWPVNLPRKSTWEGYGKMWRSVAAHPLVSGGPKTDALFTIGCA
jgi:hypothetical protein